MVKVYGIAGKTCANIKLSVGKASLQLEFTKGCLDRKNYRPATYTTGDATLQAMIENSPMFGRLIFIHRVYLDSADASVKKAAEETAPAASGKAETGAKAGQVYEDVTTYEEAITKLKSLGAKATNLSSVENIKKYMKNRNIVFPNYAF